MRNIYTNLRFTIALFLCAVVAVAQNSITGTVVDEGGLALPGANITEVGTSNGVTSDLNGNFTIETSSDSGSIEISYVGFNEVQVSFNGSSNLGNITLEEGELLSAAVLSGVIDIAKERETPVAVSTIRSIEIEDKVGNQEFPEILKSTPSIYATKQGGGYGDSRINVRGFNQRNLAVMINGQPVNDMENGWVYWSNWQGLQDIASAVQVQRGLGASRLAVPSVGGTINVVTKATQKDKGGVVKYTRGNDSFDKFTAAYNTGLSDKGWAASVLLSHWNGDGYVDGTQGEGFTYFMSLGYKPNEKNEFNLIYTGAGQWHNQRTGWLSIQDYQNFGGDDMRKFNSDWGYRDGEVYSFRRNFYNKPVASLNWDFQISDDLSLSTVLYGSWGRGGGTGPRGRNYGIYPYNNDLTGSNLDHRTSDGLIDFDKIVSTNQSTGGYTGSLDDYNGLKIGSNRFSDDGVNSGVAIRRASMNSHDWYGGISNLKYEKDAWTFGIGLDLRSYKGYHYRVLNDLLGLDGYYSTGNKNSNGLVVTELTKASPFNDTGLKSDKIDYYNVGKVKWAGVNGITEYKKDNVSAVIQAGVSNQSFQRVDYFDQPNNVESDKHDMKGGYVKGGLNYNIDEKHNVFGNAGFISKQPVFDAVFPNYANAINPDVENEKITSFELGYGYKSAQLNLNVNLYSTDWKNRFISGGTTINGVDGTAIFRDVNQRHQGIEIEGKYRPSEKLTINGMLSAGNWIYTDQAEASVFDDNQNNIGIWTLYLEDVKVGDAAQFTALIGADYKITDKVSIDASYNHINNLYADFGVLDDTFKTSENEGAVKLPSYGTIDAGFTLKLAESLRFRFNMNNVLDTEYISESKTNEHVTDSSDTYKGINTSNFVWFGFGRTWNASLKYTF